MICNEGKDCDRVVPITCEPAKSTSVGIPEAVTILLQHELEKSVLFHSDEFPSKDGEYVTISNDKIVRSLPYNSKHRKFNTYEWMDDEQVNSFKIDDIVAWCEVNEFLKFVGL